MYLTYDVAFCSRKAHVVLVALIAHISSQPDGIKRNISQRKGKYRQDPGRPIMPVKQHGQAEYLRPVQLDQDMVYGGRNGLHDDDKQDPRLVKNRMFRLRRPGHPDPQCKSQQQGDQQRCAP